MKPDLAQRRSASAYDFLKDAPTDVLTWKFLHRTSHYQRDFAEVSTAGGNPKMPLMKKKAPALGFVIRRQS